MFEFLLNLDQDIFRWINQGWSNAAFDWLMPVLREKMTWVPLYIFLFFFLLFNFKWKGWILFLFMVFTIAAADTLSSKVIKKSVKRGRPCHVMQNQEEINLLVNCGSGYSFTSSHATNHFAFAFFLIITLGKRLRWIKWPLLIWAGMISVAQIYVGLHYPFDIIGGMILGYFIARIVAGFFNAHFNLIENPDGSKAITAA